VVVGQEIRRHATKQNTGESFVRTIAGCRVHPCGGSYTVAIQKITENRRPLQILFPQPPIRIRFEKN
jgi:hypothetical protein